MDPSKKPSDHHVVLLADDDEEDCRLVTAMLRELHPDVEVQTVENGEHLMEFLQHRGKYAGRQGWALPVLVLLDLNMPLKSGWEALGEIKGNHELRHIPVVILTTSAAAEDVRTTYSQGASSFITKPTRYQKWRDAILALERYWFHTVRLPDGSDGTPSPKDRDDAKA